jgi:hypothetical protein
MNAKRLTKTGGVRGDRTGNDRGTELASARFPALQTATDKDRRAEFYRPCPCNHRSERFAESVRTGSLEPVEDNEGEEDEIKRIFQGKLFALRWLPRSARPGALRAAREWLKQAMDGLKEKRASKRYARYQALRQLRLTRKPAPE